MSILNSPIQFPSSSNASNTNISLRHYYNSTGSDEGIPLTIDYKEGFYFITPDPGSTILYTPTGSTIQTVFELKYIALINCINISNGEAKADNMGHLTSSETKSDHIEAILMHLSHDQSKSLYVSIRIYGSSIATPTGLDAFFQPFISNINNNKIKPGESKLSPVPPNWNPFMLVSSVVSSTDSSDSTFWSYTGNSISKKPKATITENQSITWVAYSSTNATISSSMFGFLKKGLPSVSSFKTNYNYSTAKTPTEDSKNNPNCATDPGDCNILYCENNIPSNKINYGDKITCYTPEQLSNYCKCWSSNKGYTTGFSYKIILIGLFAVFVILIFVLYYKAISGGIKRMTTYGKTTINIS